MGIVEELDDENQAENYADVQIEEDGNELG